jgi:hypothetical protein
MMPPWDMTKHEQAAFASKIADERYAKVMNLTPKARFNYLTAKGWERVSKYTGSDYMFVTWRNPRKEKGPWAVMKQTQAIRCQIWYDMEDEGLLIRAKEGLTIL